MTDDERPFKRVRCFEHVEGNWPSHVYIPIEGMQGTLIHSKPILMQSIRFLDRYSINLMKNQQLLHNDLKNILPSSLHSSIELFSDFHLSLSHPFVLRYHQIDPFLDHLSRAFSSGFQT